MNILKRYVDNGAANFFIVFISVFIINLLFKYHVVFSDSLVLDDLRSVQLTINGLKSNGGIFFHYINEVLGDLVLIRGFYLLLLSLSAVFTYHVFKQFFYSRTLLFVAIIIAFCGPHVSQQVNFIMGSYPVIGYFFFSLALILSSYIMNNALTRTHFYILSVFVGLILWLSYIGSAIMKIAFIVILIYPYLFNYQPNYFRKKAIYLSLIAFFTPLLIIIFDVVLSQGVLNHYQQSTGLVAFSLENVLTRISILYSLLKKLYINVPLGYGLSEFKYFILLITGMFILVILGIKSDDKKDNLLSPFNRFLVLFFLVGAFWTALAPSLALTFINNRYIYVPCIFLIILIFFLVDILYERGNSFLKVFFITIGVAFFVTNITQSVISLQKKYDGNALMQKALSDSIMNYADDWVPSSQILIIADGFSPFFTQGYNHYSTGFLQFLTKRKDLISLIGDERDLIGYPFVETYEENPKYAWKIVNGKKSRKHMFGIVSDRPTYAYRYNSITNKMTPQNWLIVNDAENKELYKIGVEGVELIENLNHSQELFYGIYRHYKINDAIVYNTEEELKERVLKFSDLKLDKSLNFDGKSYLISRDESLLGEMTEYTFSFWLKNHDNYNNNRPVYNDHLPFMPGLIGPLVIYQTYEGFDLRFPDFKNIVNISPIVIKNNNKWLHIEVAVDKLKLLLFVNGALVKSIPHDNFSSLSKNIILGKGYKDRMWKGEISKFCLYDTVLHVEEFIPDVSSDNCLEAQFDLSEDSVYFDKIASSAN